MNKIQTVAICASSLMAAWSAVAQAQEADQKAAIPDPTFVVNSSTETVDKSMFSIDRLSGCYGDLKQARNRVESASLLIRSPEFRGERHHPSLFAFQPDQPVCILDRNFAPFIEFYAQHITDVEEYIIYQLGCEGWECDDLFSEEEPEDAEFAALLEKYKTEFKEYQKQRPMEIAAAKQQYERYAADYDSWSKRKQKELSPETIRMTIQPKKDLPAGTMTLYSFHWIVTHDCEMLLSATREGMRTKQVQHPPVKAGEKMELWLDDVDIDLSWGFIFHESPEQIASDTNLIQDFQQSDGEGPENIVYDGYPQEPDLLKHIPQHLRERTYETPHAPSTENRNYCDEGCSG